tara:strand:- start:474 stop:1721 length:1248 start_codon:yes stop_codon:yes gene_type:complete
MIRLNLFATILLILSFSLLYSEKSSKDIEKDINKKNKEAELIKYEIDKLAKKIQNKDIQSEQASKRLIKIKEKIELTGDLIDLLKKEEKVLSSSINNTGKSIVEKEEELNRLQNKFSKMILHLYKNKSDNYLDVLLSSKNWEDMVYKIKYLEVISQQHKKNKRDIESVINELDNEIIMLTNTLLNKKNKRKNKNKDIAKLGLEGREEEEELKKIHQDKFNLEKNREKRKNELVQINKLIEKLYVNKDKAKKREEKLKKIREEKRKIENAQKSKNFAAAKGSLPWPAQGTIIKNFGIANQDGIEEKNIKIEIKTKKNQQIKAVFDGIVAEIDYNPIWSSYVIIDHGDGYHTVYANLDENSIQVSNQDYVESETVVGNTLNYFDNKKNESYGLLYFSIFGVNKNQKVTRYNPREWIR